MKASESSARVLIVDRDHEFTEVVEQSLRKIGNYDVTCVHEMASAIQLLNSQTFQLILSDMHLDDSTGIEFAKLVRKDQISAPEIVIISDDPKISLFDCHQAGICHVLRKPLDLDQLAIVIERSIQENRHFDRVNIDSTLLGKLFGQVKFHHGSQANHENHVEISNIGRGGFFFKIIEGKALPDIGQVIDFELKLGMVPNYSFHGKGIVRWVKKSLECYGAGVEFISIPEDSERLILAFVDLFKIRPFVPDNS